MEGPLTSGSAINIGPSQSWSWPYWPSSNIYVDVINLAALDWGRLGSPCTRPLLLQMFNFSEPQRSFFPWWWENDYTHTPHSVVMRSKD